MRGLLLALCFIALTAVDQVGSEAPRPITSAGDPLVGSLVFRHSVVTKESDAVGSALLKLRDSELSTSNANAEFMTLGPPGPWIPDTASGRGFRLENPTMHRLRVTLGSSERFTWLVVDDIVTGRADSRRVAASWRFDPLGGEAEGLRTVLRNAPRVTGPDPPFPPITWFSPKSFAWTTRSDTLVFEQESGPVFKLTARARVR